MQLDAEHRGKLLVENDFDALYVHRITCFRNLQKLDKNFDRKKEKILWPIFECKNGVSIMNGQGRSKEGRVKFGYNRNVFKSIPSVEDVNRLSAQKSKTGKQQREQDTESEPDSEDEWRNEDFFESSVFWRHQNKKRAAQLLNKASDQ